MASKKLGRLLLSLLVIGVVSFGIPLAANAAKKHHARSTHVSSRKATKSTKSGSGETPLTGSTMSSATAAALAAVPGATVVRATTENDGTGAYEVIVTKSDGTRVKVIENASFTVLSSSATSCH
jgi:uncharacterized membrane protein YkoI